VVAAQSAALAPQLQVNAVRQHPQRAMAELALVEEAEPIATVAALPNHAPARNCSGGRWRGLGEGWPVDHHPLFMTGCGHERSLVKRESSRSTPH